MHRSSPALLLLLLLPLLLASASGCGGADNTRPIVLGTIPPPAQMLSTVVDEFLVIYDAPVTILSPGAIRGLDRRGEIAMIALKDPDHPNWLRVRPAPGVFLIPGSFALILGAGLEVNDERQYRLQDVRLPFEFGEGSDLFLGSRGRSAVVELDRETFAEIDDVPTPGGRVPLGLRGTLVGLDVRIWVQMDSGGGDGHAVAWFAPGDGAMTEVALTTGGGDLTATSEMIAHGRDRVHLYVTFRDEALGRVRLSEIDVRTGLETRTLLLSPAAGAATAPLAIRTSPLQQDVFVTCRTAEGDLLCAVRLSTFEERNMGPEPGVDGFPLKRGGGPLVTWGDLAIVANGPQDTASLSAVTWSVPVHLFGESPSKVVGRPQDVFLTADGTWLLTGLADFDEDLAIARRSRALFYDPRGVSVGTTTSGANPMATAVRKFVPYRTAARFLMLFDNDAMAPWSFTPTGIEQEDHDDVEEGIQAVDISTVAPDAVSGTFVSGFFPP